METPTFALYTDEIKELKLWIQNHTDVSNREMTAEDFPVSLVKLMSYAIALDSSIKSIKTKVLDALKLTDKAYNRGKISAIHSRIRLKLLNDHITTLLRANRGPLSESNIDSDWHQQLTTM